MMEVSAPTSSGRAWAALAMLSLLFFVITAGTFSSLGVVLPDMVRTLGWSWSQAGLGFTVLALVCGLASYAPALVIRTLGARATLLLGGGVMAAGFLCLFGARGTGLYLMGAALEGLGFALTAIIPSAYVLSHLFRKPAGALGLYFTIGGLGGVAGPWCYLATLSLTHGWRDYWLMLAILSIALAVVAALSLPHRLGEDPRPELSVGAPDEAAVATQGWSVRGALATSQFWIIVAAYSANLLVEATVNGLSVAHLTQKGVAAGVAGGLLSLQAFVGVAARGAGGALARWVEPRRLVAAGLALLALGVMALAAGTGAPLMAAYVVGVGLGYGLTYLATTVLLLDYFGRERNLELFSTLCLVSTVAAIGPVAAGWARDVSGGFSLAFWAFAAVVVAVLLAVLLMRAPKPVRFTTA